MALVKARTKNKPLNIKNILDLEAKLSSRTGCRLKPDNKLKHKNSEMDAKAKPLKSASKPKIYTKRAFCTPLKVGKTNSAASAA